MEIAISLQSLGWEYHRGTSCRGRNVGVLKILIVVFDRDFPKLFDMGRSIGVVEASNTPIPDGGSFGHGITKIKKARKRMKVKAQVV